MKDISNIVKARRVLENRGHSPSIVNGYLYVTLDDFTSVAIHEVEIEELALHYNETL